MEGFIRTLAITVMLLTVTGAAHAAEINAFISTAIKAVTDELLPPFERANGHAIHASYGPSGALIPRFERGEPVDIFLTDRSAIDALIKQGKVVAPGTDLARTGIGIAVRKGAPKPDVSTPETLERQGSRSREGADPGTARAVRRGHLQGKRTRSDMIKTQTRSINLL
jgi:molybdate transport system substrate-binding protein